jgi:hypothetical protein
MWLLLRGVVEVWGLGLAYLDILVDWMGIDFLFEVRIIFWLVIYLSLASFLIEK